MDLVSNMDLERFVFKIAVFDLQLNSIGKAQDQAAVNIPSGGGHMASDEFAELRGLLAVVVNLESVPGSRPENADALNCNPDVHLEIENHLEAPKAYLDDFLSNKRLQID